MQWFWQGKPVEVGGGDLSQCLFFHHKSHIHWPGIERGPPWRQAGEPWLGLCTFRKRWLAAFNGVQFVVQFWCLSVLCSEHGALYTGVGHGVCVCVCMYVCGFVNEVSVASEDRWLQLLTASWGRGGGAVKHTGGLCPDPRYMRQVGNTLRVAAIVGVFFCIFVIFPTSNSPCVTIPLYPNCLIS